MPVTRWRAGCAWFASSLVLLGACSSGSEDTGSAVPSTTPTSEATTTSAYDPDADAAGCAALGLTVMGDPGEGPQPVQDLAERFTAMAAEEPPGTQLVCGDVMAPWRDDMVVQELERDGRDDGVLLAAIDGSQPVFRLSEVEWTSYRDFRNEANHNFLGPPTERIEIDGKPVLKTTRGGVVFERPDTWGNGLVGGAWDYWVDSGGPDGTMGLPMGRPTGTIGQGAHQDFAKGRLHLDGVTSSLEAEAAPADAFRWSPQTPTDEVEELKGNVVSITGTAYIIDREGTRHWLPSKRTWGCAMDEFDATEFAPEGWLIATFPIGEPYACPSS